MRFKAQTQKEKWWHRIPPSPLLQRNIHPFTSTTTPKISLCRYLTHGIAHRYIPKLKKYIKINLDERIKIGNGVQQLAWLCPTVTKSIYRHL